MKKLHLVYIASALVALCAISLAVPQRAAAAPPAELRSPLPYDAPDFAALKVSDLKPAIELGIAQYEANVECIRAIRPEQATFENVICALDEADSTLSRVSSLMAYLRSNFSSDEVVRLNVEVAPKLSELGDRISFDAQLFALIRRLHDTRNERGWDSLQIRTIEKKYRNYVRNGALCTPEQQASLARINAELALKRLRHGNNIVHEREKYCHLVSDSAELGGLSAAVRERFAVRARKLGQPGKWAIGLTNSDPANVLANCRNRSLRELIYKAQTGCCAQDGEYDNRQLSADILNLRRERVQLLGYDTYSDYVMENNMAQNPANVYELLLPLVRATIERSRSEWDELVAFVARTEGSGIELKPWDVAYYSTKLEREKSSQQGSVRNYLLFENVLTKGVFYMTEMLYGMKFTERSDLPVYHPDVRVFELTDREGKGGGLLYLDCFVRPGKRGGAWCSRMRSYTISEGVEQMPLITISCNFPTVAEGKPRLLSSSAVKTLFHEFGHAIAGFLARGPYSSVTGNFPRDMVELPSQIHEHWAWQPAMLSRYALHHETGAPMPQELADKLSDSQGFQFGMDRANYYASTLLDLELHQCKRTLRGDEIEAFEQEMLRRYGFPEHTQFRYRTTYFNHLFSSSYPSQYYVYTWAAVLDTDAFAAFAETGDIFNPEVAERFRRHILTQIGYDEPAKQYIRFRGALPKAEALMRRYGFVE